MNKILLLTTLILSGSLIAAEVIDDEVSLGEGAVNQVWYSMETGEVKTQNGLDWHIAFQKAQFDAGVLANGVAGVKVYHIEGLTYDDFYTPLDIADKDNWVQYYNSDYTWNVGALNRGKYGFHVDEENYGWGEYDMGSHAILGSSIFVIELKGPKYYKFLIDRRALSGIWYFQYAELEDVDGSTMVEETVSTEDFGTVNYVYFNFDTGELNREPEAYLWDITFTKWIKLFQMGGGEPTPYPVTGVKLNNKVSVVQVDNASVNDAQAPEEIEYSANLTEIGDDWKELASSDPVEYLIHERVYFIRAVTGDIYKMQFSEYEGASTGVIKFKKTALTTSVNEANTFAFSVYPNVIDNSGMINIISDNHTDQIIKVQLLDLTGNIVLSESFSSNGFDANSIAVNNLSAGLYFLKVTNGNYVNSEKIIIR